MDGLYGSVAGCVEDLESQRWPWALGSSWNDTKGLYASCSFDLVCKLDVTIFDPPDLKSEETGAITMPIHPGPQPSGNAFACRPCRTAGSTWSPRDHVRYSMVNVKECESLANGYAGMQVPRCAG